MSDLGPKGITNDQILAAIDYAGSQDGAAALLGINRRTLQRRISRIKAGTSTEQTNGKSIQLREDEVFKGRSVLWNPETGEQKLEWLKTDRDKDAQLEALKEAAEALKDDIPAAPEIPAPAVAATKLLNLFVLTDAHIGMLAWGEETGEDWDTNLAEDMIIRYFQVAIDKAPVARRAIFAQMGDFLHYDGIDSVTPSSGHQLDTDTRFAKLVRTGIRISRQIIEMLLHKYPSVEVVMADGNHDPVSEIWLREALADRYRENPRLYIDTSPAPFYSIEHGATSLFFHHGHLKKIDQIDRALTAEFREVFGRTKHSYCHVGHLHHHLVKETELMQVEQHGTLSARDAYASRHGFKSARQAQVITYHEDHGDVGRIVITPQQLED
jgi:hypothetical protein